MSFEGDKKGNELDDKARNSLDNNNPIEENIEAINNPVQIIQEHHKVYSEASTNNNNQLYTKPRDNINDEIEGNDNTDEVKDEFQAEDCPIIQRNKVIDEYINDLDKKEASKPKEAPPLNDKQHKIQEEPQVKGTPFHILKKKSNSSRSKVLYNNGNKKPTQPNDNPTAFNWNNQFNHIGYNEFSYKHLQEPKRNKAAIFANTVESTKKRNNTAKTFNKYNLGDTHSSNMFRGTTRIGSTFKPGKKLELKQNQMLKEMNNPRNPYSTSWTNKILDKRYNMELSSHGFLNGIPLIKLNHKNHLLTKVTKKQIKESLARMKEKKEPNEVELKPEVEDQFNTNMKNFFKVRKDIQEEADENEDSDKEKKSGLIEFPMIYNFFQK